MSDDNTYVSRALLGKYFDKDPRLISAFENQGIAVEQSLDAVTGTVVATDAMVNATVITLSPNAVFNNEYVLGNGSGTALEITEGNVVINVDDTVARSTGQLVTFSAPGNITLGLPSQGTLVSDISPAILYNKTLDKTTKFQNLVDAPTVAEAAAAGVPLWGVYRDGKTLQIRTV